MSCICVMSFQPCADLSCRRIFLLVPSGWGGKLGVSRTEAKIFQLLWHTSEILKTHLTPIHPHLHTLTHTPTHSPTHPAEEYELSFRPGRTFRSCPPFFESGELSAPSGCVVSLSVLIPILSAFFCLEVKDHISRDDVHDSITCPLPRYCKQL